MKHLTAYISGALFAVAGLTACNDNFELPPINGPEATIQPNSTIEFLKNTYWQSQRNYVSTITAANGDNVIIAGRVISQSASGNIYNSIVIQQKDGPALNIAVRTKNLSSEPLFGQEIVIDATGLKIGGYNNLMQLGAEGSYNGSPSMTFMEASEFEAHAQINGLPNPALVDTINISMAEVVAAKSTTEGLIKYQSQLVRVDNVTFETPGLPYATDKNTDRYIKDADGNKLNVRTSSYASFKDELIPQGEGSVIGILSYYNNDWQILLNDITGIVGFTPSEGPDTPDTPDQPGQGDGSEENPFSVAQIQGGASGTGVWTKGYIVGWIEGRTLADGAKFTTPATVASNILVADAADVKDASKCIPVQLPAGDVRNALNLVDHATNLGKEVLLKADCEAYFGTPGLKNTSAYKIDGASQPETPDTPADPVASLSENFDAATSIPAGWTQVQVAGNKSWYIATYQENNYASMTGYKGTAPFDQYLVSPAVDMAKAEVKNLSFRTQVNGYGSSTTVFEVYVLNDPDPAKATVKTKLSPVIATPPASGYSEWAQSGVIDLSAFSGTVYIAFRYAATQDTNYGTWCLDNVAINVK